MVRFLKWWHAVRLPREARSIVWGLGAALLVAEPLEAAGTIRVVEVTGNSRLTGDSVRQHAGLAPGDSCAPARLDAALKAAFASGHLADVRIDCADGVARIAVVESPIVAKLTFEGRSAVSEADLTQAARLAPRDVYTRAKAEAAAERLRELYRARGHEDVGVAIGTKPAGQGRVEVTFTITETAVVKVERIAFSGNRAFPDSRLRDVITTREAGLFDFLRTITAPVPDRLEHDRALLEQHYRRHGYADVRVGEAQRTRGPTATDGRPGGWHVLFPIDEGERYTIGAITLTPGLAAAMPDSIRPRLPLATGDVHDTQALDKAMEAMTAALIESGHPSAEAVARPARDPKRRVIDVTFELRQGPHLVIERIELAGNRATRDHVIRRELTFAEGDVYHPLRAEQARKRLKRLGLFKAVEITRRAGTGPDARSKVILTIAVEEIDSREVGFGAGYSTTEGLIGDISLTERNLMGRGQTLKLEIAGSQTGARGLIGFTEPRFLGTRLAAGFDLFYRDSDLTSTSSYKSTRWGGTIRVGTEIAPDTTATFNYTLSRTSIYDVGPDASQAVKLAIPGYPDARSAAFTTSSVGYSLAYDTRDRRVLPMRGVLITGGQDLAGLGGDVRWLRSTAEARAYVPVTESIQLAAKASAGTISGWGGSEVSLLDHFYRGGETVRGFAASGIGARDILSPRRDSLGGTTHIATTAELRFPLPLVPESAGLRGAVFADAGTLFGASPKVKGTPGVVGTAATMRASVGAGLIWDSPVGPLQTGYAVPVTKQGFDKTQNFYFGLGSGL